MIDETPAGEGAAGRGVTDEIGGEGTGGDAVAAIDTDGVSPEHVSGSGSGWGPIDRLMTLPPRWLALGLFVLVALPLIVALVTLGGDRWYPVLDMAMTELRVRDVGTSHTPLIGLPGRIGVLPDVGSHPGPLSFWVLAPTYRLFGERAYGLEVGTVLVQLAAIAGCLWCGYRLARRAGMLLAAVLLAVVIRGYGMELLTTPWNPYFPLLAWVLVLLSTTAVLMGHQRWILMIVVAGTFAAQTHVPYLFPSITMFCLAAAMIGWQAWRDWRGDDGAPGFLQFVRRLPMIGLSVVVGFFLWLPPIIDELREEPGNISRLREHFATPDQDVLGLGEGVQMTLRHLNVVDAFGGLATGSEKFVSVGLDLDSTMIPGVFVGFVWLLCAAFAVRAGSRLLRSLHAVVAAGVLVAIVSISRIFGMPWYYLTLWVWSIAALMLVTIVLTVVAVLRHWRPTATFTTMARPAALSIGGLVLLFATVTTSANATNTDHIEEYLGDPLEVLVPDTYQAIVNGVGDADGADGLYRLRWSDALYIHSQAYGVLNELDREGLNVKVDPFFTIPATEHRAMEDPDDPAITATIQFANGPFVEVFRQRPDAVEVATFDPRSSEEDDRTFERSRQLILDEIDAREADGTFTADRADELRRAVDENLFLVAEELNLSTDAHAAAARMGDIGVETAIFILPAHPPAS